jgi:hypothetical protein
MEWRNKKEPEKVVYSYEQAHHQHHYDEQHHIDPTFEEEDKGWLSGLWSRSGPYDGSLVDYAHSIAYSAQKPSQNSAYSAQKLSQDPTRLAHTSAQDSARYGQTATQQSARYGKKTTQNEANYDTRSA